MELYTIIFAAVCSLAGALLAYLWLRNTWQQPLLRIQLDHASCGSALADRDVRLQTLDSQVTFLQGSLEYERTSKAEMAAMMVQQRETMEKVEGRVKDAFAGLSLAALRDAKKDLLELVGSAFQKSQEEASCDIAMRHKSIETLVKPISDTLQRINVQAEEIERRRSTAYGALQDQISSLHSGTQKLAAALSRPDIRGSWGEFTLETLCERAGLIEGEHFTVQHDNEGTDGAKRPDLVVHLPKGRKIIVDAKAPLNSYLDAVAATDDGVRAAKLKAHAKALQGHIKQLSSKTYWKDRPSSPDCTVLFVPIESAYMAALGADPNLLDEATKARIILANPSTLISLLRATAHVLNDERLRQDTESVKTCGQQLYDAIRIFLGHFGKIGKHLKQGADAYNSAIASAEKTLMPRAQKLKELGCGSGDDLDDLTDCDALVRPAPSEGELS